jgi:hypothetical protein
VNVAVPVRFAVETGDVAAGAVTRYWTEVADPGVRVDPVVPPSRSTVQPSGAVRVTEAPVRAIDEVLVRVAATVVESPGAIVVLAAVRSRTALGASLTAPGPAEIR